MPNMSQEQEITIATDVVVLHPRVSHVRGWAVAEASTEENFDFQLGIFIDDEDETIFLATNVILRHDDLECQATANGVVSGVDFDVISAMSETEIGNYFAYSAAAIVLYRTTTAAIRQVSAIVEMETTTLSPTMPEPTTEVIRMPDDTQED